MSSSINLIKVYILVEKLQKWTICTIYNEKGCIKKGYTMDYRTQGVGGASCAAHVDEFQKQTICTVLVYAKIFG